MRLGWFSTGRDTQARRLLETTCESIIAGTLGDIKISCVFVNRDEGESAQTDQFVQTVRNLGIPLVFFSSQQFQPHLREVALRKPLTAQSEQMITQWRDSYDKEVLLRLTPYKLDAVFLAGYMLIMGPQLCQKIPILNLHPALPGGPKGSWQEVIWQLITEKCQESGIMIHRVTSELDAGPTIAYCRFPIHGKQFDFLWRNMEKKLTHGTIETVREREGENEPLFHAIREQQVRHEIPLILETMSLLGTARIDPANPGKPHFVELFQLDFENGNREQER